MNRRYKELVAVLGERFEQVQRSFEDPVITYREGKVVEDEDATVSRALTIWLGGRIDPTKGSARDLTDRVVARGKTVGVID